MTTSGNAFPEYPACVLCNDKGISPIRFPEYSKRFCGCKAGRDLQVADPKAAERAEAERIQEAEYVTSTLGKLGWRP